MDYLRQTISSNELGNIVLPPSLLNRKIEVIILPVDDDPHEKTKSKRSLGFVKCPPLPDSFFDPLPEEELELWGL